ncbi:MAG: hypothetical protein EA425_00230 [Puniceicoccaceae bacterium]|nr:MAG: hypothetical protein EA425_00230 [Puniceicoccaceae bacterium]
MGNAFDRPADPPVNALSTAETTAEDHRWYCLRAKVRREHLAASCLHSRAGLTTYCPRITLERRTVHGPRPFTESLFPGYFFARFSLAEHFRLVLASQDVTGVVRFGLSIPELPASLIADLRQRIGEHPLTLPPAGFQAGDWVEVISGAFLGSSGRVIRWDRAADRVSLLLDFLGQEVAVSFPARQLRSPAPRAIPGALAAR